MVEDAGRPLGQAVFIDGGNPRFLAPSVLGGTLADGTWGLVTGASANGLTVVATKDIRFGSGGVRGQIKFEVLNLTNTVKVRGPISTVGSSTFGQIRVQYGFMRLTQLMFRVSF